MKLKSKVQDFLVEELLRPELLQERGRHRVYRVTKSKLTSLEAASMLARLAGVAAGEVSLAGLKDRQGVTTQYMSIERGRDVFHKTPALRIEAAGFATHEINSRDSLGNRFSVRVRDLQPSELNVLEENAAAVRQHGLPNYFGEQRFGNLRHGQGWIARDLALGRFEDALKDFLSARSEHDDERMRNFKNAISMRWGDWRALREVAGKFGAHHSIFEHLARHDGDFAGAFRYVKKELRLIHLYAWQSHVFNRALARYVDLVTPPKERFPVRTAEGMLVFPRGALSLAHAPDGLFRLPGPGLEDVRNERQRELLAQALNDEGLQPGQFVIDGVPGFQLKGEDREILVHPRDLLLEHGVRGDVMARFSLPRGAYATLVLMRLVPPATQARGSRVGPEQRAEPAPGTGRRGPRTPHGGADKRGARPPTRGASDKGRRKPGREKHP